MSDESKITSFDKMVSQFKDMASLQGYCNAQYATITELGRQVNVLKEEKASLEKLLKDTVPSLPVGMPVNTSVSGSCNIIEFPKYVVSPEEEICLQQLHILNSISKNRELTLEEARRLEIYSKIIISLKNAVKDIETPSQQLSNEDLLKLANSLSEVK